MGWERIVKRLQGDSKKFGYQGGLPGQKKISGGGNLENKTKEECLLANLKRFTLFSCK